MDNLAGDDVPFPQPGSSVELVELGDRSSLARVQLLEDAAVTVVMPFDAAITAATGADFTLTWPAQGGVATVPVTVIERTGAAQIQLWRLRTTGPVRVEQRRHERRVPVDGKITVAVYPSLGPRALPATQDDPRPLTGTLIDLSTSAAQCVVRAEADDAVMHTGSQVTCHFTLGDRDLALRGSILGAWTGDTSPLVRVIVQFDAGQPDLALVVDYIGSVED